ncbi:MAG TPA: membrane protein insertase YidC, partial [Nitrospirota bacterium]
FKNDSYAFNLDIQSSKPYTLYMGDGFGSLTPKEEKGYGHIGPVVFVDGQRSQDKPEKLAEPKKYTGKTGWAALCDKFFIAAIIPKGPVDAVSMKGSTDLGLVAVKGADGGSYLVYAGPKEYDRLKSFNIGLEQSIDFGWFSFIAKPLFVVLKFFYGIVKNYGWAIILLTIVVKLLFAPLTHKSQKAMKKMQKLQPMFAELKEKYKGDAQRMNAEMMAIYKREKVNPMGGCLPMLIQIPVFIALYNVLNNAIELRQAPFVWWLTDLSSKDPYYVLPILMGLSMVVMQKMTPTSMDPMQNKMMMFMPVILTFMFISLPSGLVLYFTVSNLLSMAQQFYINKYSTD